MDVNDVTDQYWQMLKNQKETLSKAKRRKGERPKDRKSPAEAYLRFTLASAAKVPLSGVMIHSSFVPPSYPPCTRDVSELKPMIIAELQLETHHRGRSLLLRSITSPHRMTAIMVLAEDEEKEVAMLQLYQQPPEEVRSANDIISVGSVVVLKEPYYKIMADGEYGLRVDHLSDIIYLDKYDDSIPAKWSAKELDANHTINSLKLKGNDLIGKKRYFEAITEYSHALRQPGTESEIAIVQRNRALAFLKIRHFDAALADAGFPSFTSQASDKALFRAAESLYFLARWQECWQVLEQLKNDFPKNSAALALRDGVQIRCAEQLTGQYNFELMQAKAAKTWPPNLMHATYIGPVEIKNVNSKGRGLFVTKALKAGDLILCEKAFASAYVRDSSNDESEGDSKISVLLIPEHNVGFMGGHADLINTIMQKLQCNPSMISTINDLHHGTYPKVSPNIKSVDSVLDTFLVHRVVSLNVFGCPVSSKASHNDFLHGKNQTEDTKGFHSCGLWPRASYINHSCLGTARRSFIGDMMVVRATRDLAPGTEITFQYQHRGLTDCKALDKKLQQTWGFVCDCALCRDYRSTTLTVFRERGRYRESLKKAFHGPRGAQVQRIEQILGALNATYVRPPHEVPRLELLDPGVGLAMAYDALKNKKKVLETAKFVLVSLGYVFSGLDLSPMRFVVVTWGDMSDSLVGLFLLVKRALIAGGRSEDAEQAEAYARTAYKIVVGEDTSFQELYGYENHRP